MRRAPHLTQAEGGELSERCQRQQLRLLLGRRLGSGPEQLMWRGAAAEDVLVHGEVQRAQLRQRGQPRRLLQAAYLQCGILG